MATRGEPSRTMLGFPSLAKSFVSNENLTASPLQPILYKNAYVFEGILKRRNFKNATEDHFDPSTTPLCIR